MTVLTYNAMRSAEREARARLGAVGHQDGGGSLSTLGGGGYSDEVYSVWRPIAPSWRHGRSPDMRSLLL